MKAFFPLVILSLVCLLTHAQDKSFDLSKYKLPDIKRHSLDFYFNASGHASSKNETYWNNYNRQETRDVSKFNFYSNTHLNYGYYLNTRPQIINIESSLATTIDFEKSKISNTKTISSKPTVELDLSGTASMYPWQNDFFLRIDPRIIFETGMSKQKEDGITSVKINSNTFYIDAGIGAGFGRIEPVSDLWQSYYILKKLEKQNLLNRSLQDEDIFTFAHLASKLKNERFFDFRLRKIAEMKSLDSLMHKTGLTRETDVAYFSTINDYWNFATIPPRYSGKELTFTIRPRFVGLWYKYKDRDNSDSQTTSIIPSINYENKKQINLFFDREYWIGSSPQCILSQPDNNYSSFYSNLYAGYKLSYFPNFRTSASASISYIGDEFTDYRKKDKEWSNRIDLDLHAYYYIAPQLRISASTTIQYRDKVNGLLRDAVNAQYQLSFSYAIF